MEKFQESLFNSNFFGEHLEQGFVDTERLKFEEEEEDNNMPFLEMLQNVEYPQLFPYKESNFETLVRFQHQKKPWVGISYTPTLEIHESCVTNEMPLKSESNELQELTKKAEIGDSAATNPKSSSTKSEVGTRERRKRKRTRKMKNKEDVEKQRMTHIAVERNRRRQMNEHLSVLKSLMPPSYIQRGDHASIIGGAIDFVKELEQLLESLEGQKMVRKNKDVGCNGLLEPCCGMSSSTEEVNCRDYEVVKAEKKSEGAEIEVNVIQNHVNLKIQCKRKAGLLVKAIVALEELRLTILHLNITSIEDSVLYSFNLKISEESKIGRGREIADAVDNIFSSSSGNAEEWKRRN